jgi:hypothetical protein
LAGLLRFALFAAVLIALLVFVGLPLVGQALLSAAVRDAGIQAEDVDVSVDLLGIGILSGRAPSVHLVADDVNVSRAMIGHVDLTLRDVSISDRTFVSVTGRLDDVIVTGPQGRPFAVDTIELEGPAESTRARGHIGPDEAAEFVEHVARDAGLDLDGVTLAGDHVVLEKDGTSTDAALRVDGDALILDRAGSEPIVLLAPAPSEDWSLQDVRVSPDGLRIDVNLDARDIAAGVAPQSP